VPQNANMVMDTDAIIGIVFGCACGLALVGAIATLAIGTLMKTRFGMNFGKAFCAQCDRPAPKVRMPKNTYEILWGGWTCEQCGCPNDKWGNPI
jgi:hypothetical protein